MREVRTHAGIPSKSTQKKPISVIRSEKKQRCGPCFRAPGLLPDPFPAERRPSRLHPLRSRKKPSFCEIAANFSISSFIAIFVLPKKRAYEHKGFARTDGFVGVVAFVVSDLFRMLGHGCGIRTLHQPLQFCSGRRLRHGYRAAQHLPVDSEPARCWRRSIRRVS